MPAFLKNKNFLDFSISPACRAQQRVRDESTTGKSGQCRSDPYPVTTLPGSGGESLRWSSQPRVNSVLRLVPVRLLPVFRATLVPRFSEGRSRTHSNKIICQNCKLEPISPFTEHPRGGGKKVAMASRRGRRCLLSPLGRAFTDRCPWGSPYKGFKNWGNT